MGDPEIICLSSDEDEVTCPPDKQQETSLKNESFPSKLKIENKSDISDHNQLESETCNKPNNSLEFQSNKLLKCMVSPNSVPVQISSNTLPPKDEICKTVDKKRKISVTQEPEIVTKKPRNSCTQTEGKLEENNCPESPVVNASLLQAKKDANVAVVKPQLIMKEKRDITPVDQDIFPMFISLCLQKDRSPDMETVVNKLKRNYEQMDANYARSESFTRLLNEKREAIISGKGLYTQISDLNLHMKEKNKKRLHLKRENTIVKNNQQSLPCSTNNTIENVKANTEYECEEEEDYERVEHVNKKIHKIVKAMNKCERVIKKLEEEEVDFNEESDSSYIKLEKYKERMVELYSMYCKLTGENPDAGRPYLRPKHFSSTQIVVVDQAISKFVNSEIMKKNKIKSTGALTDALIFPDYMDILQCISNCNDKHNLGLSQRKQGQIAKKAFIELGEHLQRVRQQDYWDTFSLFLEKKEEDPALKNPELAEKLKKNRQEGEQKMKELFDEYVKKQENFSEAEEVEEENDDDDEDEEKDSSEEVLEIVDKVDVEEVVVEKSDKTPDISTETKDKQGNSKEGTILEKPNPTKQNVQKGPIGNNGNEAIKVVDSIDVEVTENKLPNTTNNGTEVNEDKDSEDIIEITEVKKSDSKELKNNRIDLKKSVIETEVQLSDDTGKTKEYQPLIKVRSFATPPSTWKEGTDKPMVLQELSVANSYGEGHEFTDNIIVKTNYQRGNFKSVKELYTVKVLPSSSSGKKNLDISAAPKSARKNVVLVKSVCSLNDKKAYVTELNVKHKKTDSTHNKTSNVCIKSNIVPKTSTPSVCPTNQNVGVSQNLNSPHPLPK